MSSDIAIKVENLSKSYRIYGQPRDRLKQFVIPRMQRLIGLRPSHYYHDFWALKDVSFDVTKGEAVGVIGRNGSGKSTLLQIITGTLSPTAGSVTTHGSVAALLELGSGFNPDFTGRENVYLNGTLLGFSKAEIDDKFDAIAGFADIGEHLEQPVKTYSSGMLVRLAFAVQVQAAPDILIVDEALAVGDALFQKRCFQRIEKLLSDGTTLLFVSHDQESVRTLTTRALLLHQGQALHWGQSSEVVLRYRKLLHDEESAYFAGLTASMVDRATQSPLASGPPDTEPQSLNADTSDARHVVTLGADQLSFGDGTVRIVNVQTLDSEGNACSLFCPGERLCIRITCVSYTGIERLNVAVRLRNKEGLKIYSWGTLNQDMSHRARNADAPLFWAQHFAAGATFQVLMECNCALGENLYEVQASVSHEETMNYLSQRMLHWLDEAAFFRVSVKRDEYFFGGAVDLQMSASWQSPQEATK